MFSRLFRAWFSRQIRMPLSSANGRICSSTFAIVSSPPACPLAAPVAQMRLHPSSNATSIIRSLWQTSLLMSKGASAPKEEPYTAAVSSPASRSLRLIDLTDRGVKSDGCRQLNSTYL